MHGAWWQWAGLGGLLLVILYFGMWLSILKQMDEVEDAEE